MNRRDLLNELYNLNCTEIDGDDDYESSSSSSSDDDSDSDNTSSDGEYSEEIGRKRGDRGDPESDRSIIKRLLADLDRAGCAYEFKTRRGSFSVTSSQNELRSVAPEARVPAQSPDIFPPPLFVVNGKSEARDKTTFLRYAKPFCEAIAKDFSFGNDIEKVDPKTVDDFVNTFIDYKNGDDTSRDDVFDVFSRRILKKKNEIDALDDIPALVSGNINSNDNDDDETLYDIIESEMTDICQQLSVCIVEHENSLRAKKEASAKGSGSGKDADEEGQKHTDSGDGDRNAPQDNRAGKKLGSTKAQAKTPQETPQKGKGKGKKSEPPTQKPKQDDSPSHALLQAQVHPPPPPPPAAASNKEAEEKDEPRVIGRCCFSGCKESGGKILSTDSYSEFRCTAKCVFMLHKKCIKQFDNNLNNGFVQGVNNGGSASSSAAAGCGGTGGGGSGNCPGCNYMDCPTPSCWGKLMSVRRVTVDNGVHNEKLIVVIKKDQIKKLFGAKGDQGSSKQEAVEVPKKSKNQRKKAEKKAASLSLSQGTSSSGPALPPTKQPQQQAAGAAATTATGKKSVPVAMPAEKDEVKTKESEKPKVSSEKSNEEDDKKKGPEIAGVENDKGAKIIVLHKASNDDSQVGSNNAQKKLGKKKSAKKEKEKENETVVKKDPPVPVAQKAVESENRKEEEVKEVKERKREGLISFDQDVFSQGYWNRAEYPPWTEHNDELFVRLGWKGRSGKSASTSFFKYKSVFEDLFG